MLKLKLRFGPAVANTPSQKRSSNSAWKRRTGCSHLIGDCRVPHPLRQQRVGTALLRQRLPGCTEVIPAQRLKSAAFKARIGSA
jgi:hypothetical protein